MSNTRIRETYITYKNIYRNKITKWKLELDNYKKKRDMPKWTELRKLEFCDKMKKCWAKKKNSKKAWLIFAFRDPTGPSTDNNNKYKLWFECHTCSLWRACVSSNMFVYHDKLHAKYHCICYYVPNILKYEQVFC